MDANSYIEKNVTPDRSSLTTTKARVLEAAKDCPNARRVLEKLFPEVFPPIYEVGGCYRESGTNSLYLLTKPTSDTFCLISLGVEEGMIGRRYCDPTKDIAGAFDSMKHAQFTKVRGEIIIREDLK